MSVVLDTHAALWLLEGSPKLGLQARETINHANQAQTVYVSAISFWEVAMLVAKDRLGLTVSAAGWRDIALEEGVREIAVSGDIGIAAAELSGFHGDPADRIIVATALRFGATLVTADGNILGWSGPLLRLNARL